MADKTECFGVYEALIRSIDTKGNALCVIPQIYGDQQVPVDKWVGPTRPTPDTRGFVAFIGGDPAWPVWLG
jgi:hypothetical protein